MKSKLKMTAAMTATMSFIASAAFAEPPPGKGKNKAKKVKERVEQVDRKSRSLENRRDGERRQDGTLQSEEAKQRSFENRRDGDRRQDANRRQKNDEKSDVENRRNENALQNAERRQDADKRQDSGFTDELRENRQGVEAKGKGKKKGWFTRLREGRANKKNRN